MTRVQKQTREKNFWDSKEIFQQLAENIEEGFWMTDPPKKHLFYLSPGYERIWGRPLKVFFETPKKFLQFIHPADRVRIAQKIKTQHRGNYHEEYRIVLPDGSLRWIHDRAFPIRDSAGEIMRVAGVTTDITERKKIERKWQQLAEMDGLTGLANHHFFQKKLLKKFRAARKAHTALAVAMIDLDDFKMINDNFGHQAGDCVLQSVARILRENLRDKALVARYGGEEFTVLFDERFSQPGIMRKMLNELRSKITEQKILFGRRKIHITASFGAAFLSTKTATPKELVAAADRAMYAAKAAGKNCCRFV
ncbi:MAG: sensor domain-containing diguanylate cyclase [Patescibacteria group bacterium]